MVSRAIRCTLARNHIYVAWRSICSVLSNVCGLLRCIVIFNSNYVITACQRTIIKVVVCAMVQVSLDLSYYWCSVKSSFNPRVCILFEAIDVSIYGVLCDCGDELSENPLEGAYMMKLKKRDWSRKNYLHEALII